MTKARSKHRVDERSDARGELDADRRRERALLWKGLLALLVVVALVLARQQWWV